MLSTFYILRLGTKNMSAGFLKLSFGKEIFILLYKKNYSLGII